MVALAVIAATTVAHAEIGNHVIARNYLSRALALQPTWIAMAMDVPQLAAFVGTSARARELLAATFGPQFAEWSAHVPSLVPRSFSRFLPAAFSWSRAISEVHAFLAIGAGFFVVIVLQDSIAIRHLAISPRALIVLLVPAIPFVIYTAVKKVMR